MHERKIQSCFIMVTVIFMCFAFFTTALAGSVSVTSTGIKFSDGTIQTTAAIGEDCSVFNFLSGTYEGKDGTYAVGIGGHGDRPAGSLNSITADTVSASWIGGLVEGHPMLNGLSNIEGISFPEGYAYGRWGASYLFNDDFDSDNGWKTGYLIGVQQTDSNLSFFLFENSEGIHSFPINSGSIRLVVSEN